MKQLKFSEPLPGLVLDGAKNTTWRINDKRGIVDGDMLSLCYDDGREFAKAIATSVREIMFEELSKDDKAGHETFANDEEMYATYSRYYNMAVTPKTNLKIIKFRLIT